MAKTNRIKLNWKYALGEILLIFIGISLAIAFQNWNDQRKVNKEEEKLLKSIQGDFERTKSYLTSLNMRRDESIYNFNELIKVRDGGDYSNTLHVDTLMAKSTFTPTYNGSASSIAVIINSGKINLLSSDTLKLMLLSWPQQVENLIEREQDAKVITSEEWVPFAQQYLSLGDWFKNFSFPSPARNRTSQVSNDYQGFFKDRNFENVVTKLELLYLAGKSRTNGLIRSADEIITLIKSDLEGR